MSNGTRERSPSPTLPMSLTLLVYAPIAAFMALTMTQRLRVLAALVLVPPAFGPYLAVITGLLGPLVPSISLLVGLWPLWCRDGRPPEVHAQVVGRGSPRHSGHQFDLGDRAFAWEGALSSHE
ncbi:MAG: hypothetical protein C0502_04245 [Opitutus sp.]|nr:hypothetical protein [Opitutus sp.]